MNWPIRTVIFFVLLISQAQSQGTHMSWSWVIADSIPHPENRFLQGLFWHAGMLYESTGLVGSSRVFRMNRQGVVQDSAMIPPPHFGEGSTIVGDDLLVLTWRSRLGFVMDAQKLTTKGSFPIPGEGWGLALHGSLLFLSDGSQRLWKLAPDTREVLGFVDVQHQGNPIVKLNELESYGKYLLANIWYSDSIAIIDPQTGQVAHFLDLSALSQKVRARSREAEVLNGIAWDGKLLWVSGKRWPQIYALRLKEPSSADANGIRGKQK